MSASGSTSLLVNPADLASPPTVVLIGPPGSGKGTQCARLAQSLGVAHLSVGDVLHDEVARESTLGLRARAFIETGRLVPDDLVVDLVATRLSHHRDGAGIVLDGFPRTVGQAEALEKLSPDGVRLAIELVVPMATVVRRLTNRARCDDRPDVVRHRLASYCRETLPVLRWFAARGLLVCVDGNQAVESVTTALCVHLAEVGIEHRPG